MPMPPDYMELAQEKPPRPPWDWPPLRVPFYWEYGQKPIFRDDCGCLTDRPWRAGGTGVMTAVLTQPRVEGE